MERWQFQDAVDRFGPDFARWPVAERLAGEALVSTDPAAAAILAEACRLRDLIRSTPEVAAPRGLAARIVATALAQDLPEVSSPPTSVPEPTGTALPRPAHSPIGR